MVALKNGPAKLKYLYHSIPSLDLKGDQEIDENEKVEERSPLSKPRHVVTSKFLCLLLSFRQLEKLQLLQYQECFGEKELKFFCLSKRLLEDVIKVHSMINWMSKHMGYSEIGLQLFGLGRRVIYTIFPMRLPCLTIRQTIISRQALFSTLRMFETTDRFSVICQNFRLVPSDKEWPF